MTCLRVHHSGLPTRLTESVRAQDLREERSPLGLRADFPLGDRLGARAFVAGGGLPPVNSLRKEGGTIYLSQAHADAGASVIYRITRFLEAEAGYRFSYFFPHEKSHEDDNTFRLSDGGFRLGVNF